LNLFVDRWGWVALADHDEPRHLAAAKLYAERKLVPGQLVTSNFVLDEFFSMVFARRPFALASRFCTSLLASPKLKIEFVNPDRFNAAFELRLKLADKPRISFTDITSMIIMRELGILDVMTGDDHFRHVGLGFRTLPE
jgi:predicted nucleic acid-binding protein